MDIYKNRNKGFDSTIEPAYLAQTETKASSGEIKHLEEEINALKIEMNVAIGNFNTQIAQLEQQVTSISGSVDNITEDLEAHINNNNIHVSEEDRNKWDSGTGGGLDVEYEDDSTLKFTKGNEETEGGE